MTCPSEARPGVCSWPCVESSADFFLNQRNVDFRNELVRFCFDVFHIEIFGEAWSRLIIVFMTVR